MAQQPWTPDQRRQQVAELLRNKGVICRDFLFTGRCPRTPTCPYMHIANGETRPVPWSVCTFFTQGKCLRDRCSFFHGTPVQLEELHASGVPIYRPQDYMKIASPPSEYLNPDGSIAAHVPFSPAPPTSATLQVIHSPSVSHENTVNSFHPVVIMQPNTRAIAPTMFAPQGHPTNASTAPFSFYTNSPLSPPMPSAGAVIQPAIHAVPPMQAGTFYPTANVHLQTPQPSPYAPSGQYSLPQTQQALVNPIYFHIQHP